MFRIFISALVTAIFLLSSLAIADEKADRKTEVLNLYKSYKSRLRAGDTGRCSEDCRTAFYGEEHTKTARALFWQAKLNMGYKKKRWAA